MATRLRSQLKSWFKHGSYPRAEQFADWMDSYWHKIDDEIPINAVEELADRLNGKYNVSDAEILEAKTDKVIGDLANHEIFTQQQFEGVNKNIDKLKSEDVKINAAIDVINEDIDDLQAADVVIKKDITNLQAADKTLQASLTNAHTDIGKIRNLIKGGATLDEAKAALLALGNDYKDVHTIADTLKTFLEANDTVETSINTWREIETFLQGISDTQNLTALLNQLEQKVTKAYTAAIAAAVKIETDRAKIAENDLSKKFEDKVSSLVITDNNIKDDVSELKQSVSTILADINPIAGRYWIVDNSTPIAAGYYGSLHALKNLPAKLGLGRYLVQDDRTRRKLDPADSTRFEDGSPAKLDGTQGQCMWCWNAHYYTTFIEGNKHVEAITFAPIEGKKSVFVPEGGTSWLSAGVIDRTNNKLCSLISNDPQYRGGGGVTLSTTIPAADAPQKTMLGMAATLTTNTDFGVYARKRGEGWEASWFVSRAVVEYTTRIILGNRNIQTEYDPTLDEDGLMRGGLGNGATNFTATLWSQYNNYSPLIPNNVCLSNGDGTGVEDYSITRADGTCVHTFAVPMFFGLVNPFGHLWSDTRGLLIDAQENTSRAYIAGSMYAEFDNTTAAGKLLAAEMPVVEDWIKKVSMNGLCSMPTELGGSPTTYYGDYYYRSSSSFGLCVRLAGGSANYGRNAGSVATYMTLSVSDKTANVSAPLCYFTEDPIMTV